MDPESILIILISLLLSAFFSGMEIAFVASNKLHIELLKKRGEFNAKLISAFLDNPSRFIATMLVGNNIALVIYGIQMALLLEPMLSAITQVDSLVLLLQTVISTLIVLVTAEFLPKVFFGLNADRLINLLAVPASLSYYLLFPVVSVVIYISNAILKHLLGLSQLDQKPVFGRLDLEQYVSQYIPNDQVKDSIDSEIQIFKNALDFNKVKARECMIPRNEIVALDINDDISMLKETFVRTGLSKVLIYKEHVDRIIGFTHSYEMFKSPQNIKDILLPIALVPETMPANEVLNIFTRERKSLALVVDEFGGTAGLLTVEDVIEEIFGEIEDEYDKINLNEQQVTDTEFLFSGRLEIDYLNDKYKLNLPSSDEYETLSGLIVFHCEKIPDLNTIIKIDNCRVKILAVDQTRIEQVQLFQDL